MQLSKEAMEKYVKAGYRIAGSHSAVEICHWTKESLRRGRACYKQKFYGIRSHRCLEMTPALAWCTHRCVFCWRNLAYTMNGEPMPDEPQEILDGCIEARRNLLMGFKGAAGMDAKKFSEALEPTNAAISLAGEPTLYARLPELLAACHKRGMTTFLVTNGTRPDRLRELSTEPTQLYVSLCAPDEGAYDRVHHPLIADGWEKLNETLGLLRSFSCKKVLRLTLVAGLNMDNVAGYARLIEGARPDFVECKGYVRVGESRTRLPDSAMPSHAGITRFATALSNATSYMVADEHEDSRVVLLKRK